MTVLVVGATGLVGGMVVRRLVERGEQVRAMTRPGAEVAALTAAGVEQVSGDFADPDSLRRAVAGVDAVVATANSARPRLPHDTVATIEFSGYPTLVAAAADEGVGRFVYVSAQIAHPDSPMPFLRAKAAIEAGLRDSGMPYTIIAPGPFDEVWPAGVVGAPAAAGLPVTLVSPGRHRHSFVSAADVADYCVAVLGRADTAGERLAIGGPQNLTWRDVVQVYEQVWGREVPVRFVEPGEEIPGASPVMAQMLAGFEAGHVDIDMSETAARFGITPTPLAAAVQAMAGSAGTRRSPEAPQRQVRAGKVLPALALGQLPGDELPATAVAAHLRLVSSIRTRPT